MCINRLFLFSSIFYSLHKFWKEFLLVHSIHSLLYKDTVYTVLYIKIHKFARDILKILSYLLPFAIRLFYHSDKALYG
jgi:hypothetical protein